MSCFFPSLNRSSAFQDHQLRSLFSVHYKQRLRFKETMRSYEETLRRKSHLQAELDALERREAFLEGRRENLLTQMSEVEEEEMRNLFAATLTSPNRSISKDRSSFHDSGNLIYLSLCPIPLTFTGVSGILSRDGT